MFRTITKGFDTTGIASIPIRTFVATGVTSLWFSEAKSNNTFINLPYNKVKRTKLIVATVPPVFGFSFFVAPYMILIGTAYAASRVILEPVAVIVSSVTEQVIDSKKSSK